MNYELILKTGTRHIICMSTAEIITKKIKEKEEWVNIYDMKNILLTHVKLDEIICINALKQDNNQYELQSIYRSLQNNNKLLDIHSRKLEKKSESIDNLYKLLSQIVLFTRLSRREKRKFNFDIK